MTQREKIFMLKSTIKYLFEKEGRSKSYISRVLEVDRKTLSQIMNNEITLFQFFCPSDKLKHYLNRLMRSLLRKGLVVCLAAIAV